LLKAALNARITWSFSKPIAVRVSIMELYSEPVTKEAACPPCAGCAGVAGGAVVAGEVAGAADAGAGISWDGVAAGAGAVAGDVAGAYAAGADISGVGVEA